MGQGGQRMTTLLMRRLEPSMFGCITRWLTLGLALVAMGLDALAASASEPPKDCRLKQYAELPITYYDGWVQIPLLIDNHPVRMTLDTGSALSIIGQWAVQQLGSRVTRLRSVDITVGNDHLDSYATIRELSLGNARLKDTEILIIPTHSTSNSEERSTDRVPVGRLGMDLFGGVDVELDLGHDKVNLFSTEHCPGAVVYWADRYDVVPMRRGALRDFYFSMELDGKKVQTKLATGDHYSELSSYITRSLYGWDEDSPRSSVQTLQAEDGTTRHYRSMALTSGGLQVLNAQIMLLGNPGDCIKKAHVVTDADGAAGFEGCMGVYPLHLGMSVLKKLRLYLATKEQKMYFTLADAHKASDKTACWRMEIGEASEADVVTLCTINQQAQLSVHYPNQDTRQPTTCRSNGSLYSSNESQVILTFQPGSCDNGQRLDPRTLTCARDSASVLDCVDQQGTRFPSWRPTGSS
jgi:Aspartyl protease